MDCPECRLKIPEDSKFCKECGCHLVGGMHTPEAIAALEGERKHVTIMFSDLSGYTSMTERLDPEEVKRIMSLIFGKITKIIKDYDGFVERFIGDAVMAVFGVPQAHEDDPIRAIRAALEMHAAVKDISPRFEAKIGHALALHTGINTGLVVTGKVDVQKGTHGLTGDAINLASRLEGIAKADDIIVGPDTYNQALNFFEFEALEPTQFKGKRKLINFYMVQSAKKESIKTHRLQGLQASLTGRSKEMKILEEAAEKLGNGHGSIIAICGDPGTGKSRLKKEFRDTLGLNRIQWREGHAYDYTQSIPYYPLTNLLTHAFQIEEKDPPEKIKLKVESGLAALLTADHKFTPYIGSLFAVSYPEIESVSPEYWKDKLLESIQATISALIERGPTIFCFEDLHWGDPSFIDLLHRLFEGSSRKALFICTFRSHFTLFTNDVPEAIKDRYQEIRLSELEPLDAQEMLSSLLKTRRIPAELSGFVRRKAEGNPFYLEEMINSLIESEILTQNNGDWKLTREITETDIPATIHGVLSARVDRLEKYYKRILQEASVIGRTFVYDILRKITEIDTPIDRYLSGLEDLNLIRTQSIDPDLEYIFKHALTQEVVYSGILKKERQVIHEQIGRVIEKIYPDRLPEFYDALAFHYKRSRTKAKAVQYLILSGEKSLKKYAVEESHQYYKEAYDILLSQGDQDLHDKTVLIQLLNKWALTLYYLGSFKSIEQLFKKHRSDAEQLEDQSLIGMYYIWLGMGFYCREELRGADRYLSKALKIGRENADDQVVAYALTWLCWTRTDLGEFEEVTAFATEARALSKSEFADDYPYYKSAGGEGLAWFMTGNSLKNIEMSNLLLDLGNKKSQVRSLTLGYVSLGFSHDCAGDFAEAIKCYKKAIKVAKDPMYEQYSRVFLAMALLQSDQVNEAESAFKTVIEYCDKEGFEAVGSPAKFYLGFIQILKGQMTKGMRNIEGVMQHWTDIGRKPVVGMSYLALGKLYAQMAQGKGSVSIKMAFKNIVFLIKNVPKATKMAEKHLLHAIEYTQSIKATGIKAQSLMELGLLYKSKGKKEKAIEALKMAEAIFNANCNYVFLQQTQSALKSL